MNKSEERKYFDSVFKKADWEVFGSESPDFRCERENKTVHGVEITEIFRSETSARLSRIPGYSSELLSGGPYRHKDDAKTAKVTTISLPDRLDENGRPVEAQAIMDEWPSFAERVEQLRETILSKEQKFPSYNIACPSVDLIVKDADGLFSFENFEEFLPRLARHLGSARFVGGPFREIFLITKERGNADCSVPLKLNFVMSEIGSFQLLMNPKLRNPGRKPKIRPWLVLFACLERAGFGDLCATTSDGTKILYWGPWSCHYSPDATTGVLRDRLFFGPVICPESDRIEGVGACLNRSESILVKHLVEERSRSTCVYPLFSPCEK